MNWPFVSRLAYELQRARGDYFAAQNAKLTDQLLAMRRDGFSVAKPAVIHAPPDEETEGLKRAEQRLVQRRDDATFVTRATDDMMRRMPHLSRAQAHAEAVKLRRSVIDEDPPT